MLFECSRLCMWTQIVGNEFLFYRPYDWDIFEEMENGHGSKNEWMNEWIPFILVLMQIGIK